MENIRNGRVRDCESHDLSESPVFLRNVKLKCGQRNVGSGLQPVANHAREVWCVFYAVSGVEVRVKTPPSRCYDGRISSRCAGTFRKSLSVLILRCYVYPL